MSLSLFFSLRFTFWDGSEDIDECEDSGLCRHGGHIVGLMELADTEMCPSHQASPALSLIQRGSGSFLPHRTLQATSSAAFEAALFQPVSPSRPTG